MIKWSCLWIDEGAMRAFLSYQNEDREVAGRIARLLDSIGVASFMAHEDIIVSEEWRLQLLRELAATDLFVAILSQRFFSSVWCTKESGIASFRELTIIPLSIDGTVPSGFLGHIQSTRIDPAQPRYEDLFPGIARKDFDFLIAGIIRLSGASRQPWRHAEANFELILPYINRATRQQIVELLTVSTHNLEVCNAARCIRDYLPPLIKTHGRYMKRKDLRELKDVKARYP